MAQAKGKITETELQIIQIDQDMRKEVGKELADIRGKTSELVEKKVAAAYFVNLAWMSQRNLMALSPLENLDQS